MSFPADLADGFFITFSFTPARVPRADDADIIAAFGVGDNQQLSLMRTSQDDEARFRLRVCRVGNRDGNGVAKNRCRFFKADAVLDQI
jgi:hypothetical protein